MWAAATLSELSQWAEHFLSWRNLNSTKAVISVLEARTKLAAYAHFCPAMISSVPAGSPSRGGDVKVYVYDINQPILPILFILFLCLFLSIWPFELYFIP